MKAGTTVRQSRSMLEGLESRVLFAASLVPSLRAGISPAAAAAVAGVGQNAVHTPGIVGVPVAGSNAQTPIVIPPVVIPPGGGVGGTPGGGLTGTVPPDYDPTADSHDQISEARTLTFNARQNRQIDDDVDVDMFKFTVNAGDTVGIDVDNVSGNLSFDGELRLFDAGGNELTAASDDDAAPGEGATSEPYIQFTFPTGGTFYVGVSGNPNDQYDPLTGDGDVIGDFGRYAITAVKLGTTDLNDQIGEATTLSKNSTRNDNISVPLDTDMYRVKLELGDVLNITLSGRNGTKGLTGGVIRLFDAAGAQISSSTTGSLQFISLAKGTYHIGISGAGNTNYNSISGNGDAIASTIGDYALKLLTT